MSIESEKDQINYKLLDKKHINKRLFELMEQLSSVPFDTSLIDIEKHWSIYKSQENCHSLVVFDKDLLIGFGTILIEHKLRDSRLGHIEDIVIDYQYRGKNLGRVLINRLLEIGKKEDCYKTTLSSYDKNVIFYEKLGFIKKGNQMDFFHRNQN